MSDGTISPKFGNKAFSHNCDLTGPLKRIEAKFRERGLVGLKLITDNEDLVIQGDGLGKHEAEVFYEPSVEQIVQFKVRMAQGVVNGIQFGVLTNEDIVESLGAQQYTVLGLEQQ